MNRDRKRKLIKGELERLHDICMDNDSYSLQDMTKIAEEGLKSPFQDSLYLGVGGGWIG